MPRKADAAVIRGGWRAREGVMSDFVTARIDWREARGGPCKARRLSLVLNRARVVMRGFQSGVVAFWRGAEAEPRTPVLWGKDKDRERPSLTLSGGKAGNARTLRRNEGRERPNLQWIQKPRTPVLFLSEVKSRERPYSFKDQDSREHPCWQLGGSDLVLSAPCRAVLYRGPGYGVVAAQNGVCWMLGAERATWGANDRRGARAVRARNARRDVRAVRARKTIYNILHLNL